MRRAPGNALGSSSRGLASVPQDTVGGTVHAHRAAAARQQFLFRLVCRLAEHKARSYIACPGVLLADHSKAWH